MAHEANVDLVDVVHEMTIEKLIEICGDENPEECGVFQNDGKLLVGKFPFVTEVKISLEEIFDDIAERELTGTKYENLHLMCWLETTDPLVFEWIICTNEQMKEMIKSAQH